MGRARLSPACLSFLSVCSARHNMSMPEKHGHNGGVRMILRDLVTTGIGLAVIFIIGSPFYTAGFVFNGPGHSFHTGIPSLEALVFALPGLVLFAGYVLWCLRYFTGSWGDLASTVMPLQIRMVELMQKVSSNALSTIINSAFGIRL